MTEAEALKQFIPILGRISAPSVRATITRNILSRIAGQAASFMCVSHRQAGALAWPNDTTKATAFEAALNMAVDAGDFVSTVHLLDRRHFQIEELLAWPDCPPISPDSPLTFWLGDPAPAQTAKPATVGADGDGPVKPNAPGLKQPAQENRILELLKSKDYDPLKLPDRQRGKGGAKAAIKKLALLEPALFTKKTFDTAWERLRGEGRIAGGE